MSRAELRNYLKELIETWNIDSWQCEVVHLARIITLFYFVAKLSPLDQYFNSVILSTAELINYLTKFIETWNLDRYQCEVVHLARIITLFYFVAKLSPLDQYFNSVILSTAELINYLTKFIETWNLDRYQCEVVHLARIITLDYFIAKLSPLDQYFNSVNFVHSRTHKLLEGID